MKTLEAVRLAERIAGVYSADRHALAALFQRARAGDPDALREAGEIVHAVAKFFGDRNAMTPDEVALVSRLHLAATRMMAGEPPHVAPHRVK